MAEMIISSSLDQAGEPRLVIDYLGYRYALELTRGVPQRGQRTDVRNWMGINVQCVPYEEIERRKKAKEPSLASIHHLNERSHTYHPASFARYETFSAKTLIDFLDPVPEGQVRTEGLVLRDFVNTGQLTEAGEFTGPGREQFLRDWLANGGRVIFVNAALHNESPDYATIEAGPKACIEYLKYTGPQGVETMKRIARLIKRLTPKEQAQVLAVETMNEPAIYDKMGRQVWGFAGLSAQDALDWFERDQTNIARTAFSEGIPNHVLVLFPRYKYSADAASLVATNGRLNSILDRWLDEFGDRVGISTHMYAPWVSGQYTEEWLGNATKNLSQLTRVPEVVTEANSTDFRTVERKSPAHHSGWTMAELSVNTGVPFQYFPGANWGDGALLSTRFTPDRTNEPDRLFTWYDLVARTLRSDSLDVTFPIHVIRSNTDARYVDGVDDDRIRGGLRVIRMGDGPNQLDMSGPQAIMAYGGDGDQYVTMNPDEFSWFSGWKGNDTVDARRTPGCIINLGGGEDKILLGGENVTVHGRGGGDIFVLGDGGTANIFGFNATVDHIRADGLSYKVTAEDHIMIRTSAGGLVRLVGLKGGSELRAVQAAIIK